MTPLTIAGGRVSDRGKIIDKLIDKGLDITTVPMNGTPAYQMEVMVDATPRFLRTALEAIGLRPTDKYPGLLVQIEHRR